MRTPVNQRGGGAGDRGSARKAPLVLGLSLIVLALVLVTLSPLALDGFDGAGSMWERRSFIGQTYGAAAVLISTLGGVGVAIALILQAKERRDSREQGLRTEHAALLKMAMEDRRLHAVWGDAADPGLSDDDLDARAYANMVVSFWETSFETGSTQDGALRAEAAGFFTGRIGRAFWRDARRNRLATAETRRSRRFHAIFDEEYRKAIRAPHVSDAPIRERVLPAAAPPRCDHRLLWGAAGALAAVTVGYLVGRGRR